MVQANVRSESDLVLAEAMNPVDVLVHNAAVGALRPFDKMRTNHWDLTIESSLRPFWSSPSWSRCPRSLSHGLILGSRRFTPGTPRWEQPRAASRPDAAAGRRMAPQKVRVNTVRWPDRDGNPRLLPGQGSAHPPAVYTPLKRLGQPEDLHASFASWSASAGWITGQVIVADGGFSIQ